MHSLRPLVIRRLLTLPNFANTKIVRCFYLAHDGLVSRNVNSVIFTSFEDTSIILQSHHNCFSNFNQVYRKLSVAIEPDISSSQTTNGKGKIHTELENDVFHDYMENNPNYCETVHKSNAELDYSVSDEEFSNIVKRESWTEETADNYFMCFAKVACYCHSKSLQSIADPTFSSLCAAFPFKCIHFSDEQLIKCFVCLKNWPEAPGVKDKNFLTVWKALDGACVMKRSDWNLKTTLYMIDLWYSLKLTRLSEFVMRAVKRCVSKSRQ